MLSIHSSWAKNDIREVYKRQSKTNACQINKQISAVKLNLLNQILSVGCKKLMKIFTCFAFGRKGEKRIFHQLLYFQGFSFKWKEVRIGNKNIPKFFYHLYFCVCGKPGIGKIAYDQVHLTVCLLYTSKQAMRVWFTRM